MVLEEPLPEEVMVLPVVSGVEKVWGYGIERTNKEIQEMIVKKAKDGYEVYKKKYLREEGTLPRTWWDDAAYSARDNGSRTIAALFGPKKVFDFPKAVDAVRDCLSVCSADPHALVLDYFAGSGTTAHAVMSLNREDGGNRKYILVEMGDHFGTVLKPRIQKVAFSAKWKDGVPQDRDGMSHMFKYQRIESYEDALNNIRVTRPTEGQLELLETFDDYMLHYMLDFETRDSPSLLQPQGFETPFHHKLKIQRGHESPQWQCVDLVETFHYLIGLQVRKLEQHRHQERTYVVSRGEVRSDGGIEQTVVIWRNTAGLDLAAEADWANEILLPEPVDRVYVNGPSYIRGAQPVEITFRQRMEPEWEAGRGR